MSNVLDNITINGQTLSIIWPFSFQLPATVSLRKLSATELQADIQYSVKLLGLVTVKRTGSVYYNDATGTLKFKP